MTYRNLLDDSKDILIINKPLAKVIGLHQSIVLRQLHYWLGRNTAHFKDGRFWVYNTYKDWMKDDNFPFWTEKTISRHFLELEKLGLVISTDQYNKAKYDNTKWYTIDYDKYDEIMTTYYKENPQDKMSSPSGQNVPVEQDKMSQPIPEITTENTNREEESPSPSNAYKLYEQNIGVITPIIAQEIKSAVADYPEGWFADAVKLAVTRNKRSMGYVIGILRRWHTDGKDDGTQPQPTPTTAGNGNGASNEQHPSKSFQRYVKSIFEEDTQS